MKKLVLKFTKAIFGCFFLMLSVSLFAQVEEEDEVFPVLPAIEMTWFSFSAQKIPLTLCNYGQENNNT